VERWKPRASAATSAGNRRAGRVRAARRHVRRASAGPWLAGGRASWCRPAAGPGIGQDTASCRRAGRRLVVEQPGEGLGDRDGRVAEPQANLAVLAAMTSPSVSRRTRDSGRPCSSIKLAATPVLKLRSFAGGEAAEQGGLGASGAAVPPLRPGRALRSGRAAAPAGPPGRSLRLRCNPRSRRGICRPWPAQDPGNRHPGFERGEDQAGACSPRSAKASQTQGRGQEEGVGVSYRPGAGLPSGSRRRHHRGIDAAPGRAPRASSHRAPSACHRRWFAA
jgi:hypothetical protein